MLQSGISSYSKIKRELEYATLELNYIFYWTFLDIKQNSSLPVSIHQQTPEPAVEVSIITTWARGSINWSLIWFEI